MLDRNAMAPRSRFLLERAAPAARDLAFESQAARYRSQVSRSGDLLLVLLMLSFNGWAVSVATFILEGGEFFALRRGGFKLLPARAQSIARSLARAISRP